MLQIRKMLSEFVCRSYCNLPHISSTIYALSSGQGRCGVAVIRISGPNSGDALKLVTAMKALPEPRYALLKTIKNPYTDDVIDKGIVLWFPGPKSFTGEDCCELQVHGGVAVVSAVLSVLGSINNLRLAKPGEFTRRAFFNGKLDLTEVEGLADLLAAETEAQRKQAFMQMHGMLSELYKQWKTVLLRSLAHLEADIDFGETETIDSDILNRTIESIKQLSIAVTRHLQDGKRGERLRNGAKTVIIGEPNVGKSSLFNALCQRPAAIVTPIEGTTRDVLEVMLDIGGYPLVLADTAGLRSHTSDVIEKEGISRTKQYYETADLILLVIDCLNYLTSRKPAEYSFEDFVDSQFEKFGVENNRNKSKVVILNKSDLVKNIAESKKYCVVSCKNETGFEVLVKEITEKLKELCGEPTQEHPCMNQARHRQHLTNCLDSINQFLERCSESNADIVLMAEDLRRALSSLGKLTGIVTSEEVLDVIFKDFCIGK